MKNQKAVKEIPIWNCPKCKYKFASNPASHCPKCGTMQLLGNIGRPYILLPQKYWYGKVYQIDD